MTGNRNKATGKKKLPYLLSTTATLIRCKHYFYTCYDHKFRCRKHRDYYSVDNAKQNMTRQWHDIIMFNALLCRSFGNPATWQDAVEAIEYAMTHGKSKRALEAYRQLLLVDGEKPIEDRIVTKMDESFKYYALGMNRYGKHLAKDKLVTYNQYLERVCKWDNDKIFKEVSSWTSPWKELNRLVNTFDDDRKDISQWSIKKIAEHYKCSARTANMFRLWFQQWKKEYVHKNVDDDETIFDAYTFKYTYKWKAPPSESDQHEEKAVLDKPDYSLDFLDITGVKPSTKPDDDPLPF